MTGGLGTLLVTGGAGFVGSNLIRRIRERQISARIRVIDNESAGHRKFLDGLEVDFIPGDIRCRDDLRQALSGIDHVVHLAADTGVLGSIEQPTNNFQENVVASYGLLKEMRGCGVGSIVNASTGGTIIGNCEPPVHKAMTPNPLSPYRVSKLAVEGYCSAFSAVFGMKAISLRSNVYGPFSHHKGTRWQCLCVPFRPVSQLSFMAMAVKRETSSNARDLADGIILALGSRETGVFQLGSGKPTTVLELVTYTAAE